MSNAKQMVLGIVLPVIIIAGIVVTVKRITPQKNRERQEYPYTAYGIADDGTIYKFGWEGRGLKWPVTYEGKELKPLYGCADCKAKFPGNIGAMTSQCPECRGPNVGGYAPEFHGEVNAIEIEIERPK